MPYNLDFLHDRGRRPFDEIFKRSVREPGVAQELLANVIPMPWSGIVPEEVVWLDGQLQPRQRTWNTDTIGLLGDGSILHIEQETSNHDDMDLRMMEYASLLAVSHSLRRPIRQVYICTGDHRPFEYQSGRNISTRCHAVENHFTFFHAGDFNAWAMLENPLFTVAALGLLATEIEEFPAFVNSLIDRACREYNGDRLVNQLVSCVFMASLRRRSEYVIEEIPPLVLDEVFKDPYLLEIFDAQGRGRALAFLNRMISKAFIEIPNDFIIWLARHPDIEFIEDVAGTLQAALDFEDLTMRNGIDWENEWEAMKLMKTELALEASNKLSMG